MLKVFFLLKRNPKITMEEFIDHYEHVHVPIAIKYSTKMTHYSRRYLHPAPAPLGGAPQEAEYDVVTELWFDDQKALDENTALVRQSEAAKAIAEDEAYLFDTRKNRFVFIEEHITDPSTLPANKKA